MDFIVYLVLAMFLGGLIGYERQHRCNLIGIRTSMLIMLGSFMFSWLSVSIGGDPSRVIAQIVTGTGFLSGGIIFKNGVHDVRHLTTAVLVWTLSALGALVALKFVAEAVVVTILILGILEYRFIK